MAKIYYDIDYSSIGEYVSAIMELEMLCPTDDRIKAIAWEEMKKIQEIKKQLVLTPKIIQEEVDKRKKKMLEQWDIDKRPLYKKLKEQLEEKYVTMSHDFPLLVTGPANISVESLDKVFKLAVSPPVSYRAIEVRYSKYISLIK